MVLCMLLGLFLLCLIPQSDILQIGDGSMLESLPELELEGPLSPQPGIGGELGPLHWAQSKTRTLVASYSSQDDRAGVHPRGEKHVREAAEGHSLVS